MSSPLPPALRLYRLGLIALEPAAGALLRRRVRQGKEDPARLPERRGFPSRERPAGRLAWLHGASIGETLSLMAVVEHLIREDMSVLVTSGTRTAAELVARRLPPGAVHQFVPLDSPRYVRRFLDHWRPDLTLVAESEIWPNTIVELDRRRIPLVLVNGRMSERSFRRWSRVPQIARALMGRFALCLAQSPADAERLFGLGAERVEVAGNLKFDASPPPADPRALAHLSGLLSGRPVWLAASTHPGEEEIAVAVHQALAGAFRGLLTIVVPRHPERGGEVAALARAAGLEAAQRSRDGEPGRGTELYVADTVGELGLFYRLSPLVFVGGSLVRHGGQNPIEPGKLGAAILHGPHVHNFADVYAALDGAGGALPVSDGADLARAVAECLADVGRMRDMARSAAGTVEGLGGALARTVQAIEPFISGVRAEAG
ncbi:MAG TPA: 3-deoxy-D-manno-octulosonic acid transferase [Beijerinckiaceae bacterium]|jgi:3-deoxy-D-manno-octulosonic-acid transferase